MGVLAKHGGDSGPLGTKDWRDRPLSCALRLLCMVLAVALRLCASSVPVALRLSRTLVESFNASPAGRLGPGWLGPGRLGPGRLASILTKNIACFPFCRCYSGRLGPGRLGPRFAPSRRRLSVTGWLSASWSATLLSQTAFRISAPVQAPARSQAAARRRLRCRRVVRLPAGSARPARPPHLTAV
jgi:hypothetical protein